MEKLRGKTAVWGVKARNDAKLVGRGGHGGETGDK